MQHLILKMGNSATAFSIMRYKKPLVASGHFGSTISSSNGVEAWAILFALKETKARVLLKTCFFQLLEKLLTAWREADWVVHFTVLDINYLVFHFLPLSDFIFPRIANEVAHILAKYYSPFGKIFYWDVCFPDWAWHGLSSL